MDMQDDIWPKVSVGCSGCLTLVLFLTFVGAFASKLVAGSRAAWGEILPVAIPSGVCCLLSCALLGGAIYWLMQVGDEEGG